jgi:two-component system, sensor histidine kinase PdtaS
MTGDDRSRQTEFALLVFVMVLFVLLAGTVGLLLYRAYQVSMDRTVLRAEAASATVATNAEWIDALARQALRRIDDTLDDKLIDGDPRGVSDLKEGVQGLPGKVFAYVVDENGKTLYSTDPAIKPIDIRDRDYYRVPASGTKEYVSSLMVSRLNGEQIFAFSRRLERAGRFEGVAIVSFSASILLPIWQSLDLGPGATVGIIRKDGQLVARYPQPRGPLDLSHYVLFTDYLKRAPSGSYEAVSPEDGARRIVAYRTVGGTDFIVQASAGLDYGLASFWRVAYVTLALSFGVALGLVLASYSVYRLIVRDARTGNQLRTALENNQLLLREIHHRVKNNLQSVQSLIRLHHLPDEVQNALLDRLSAMTRVHEIIYTKDAFDRLDAAELIRNVVTPMINAHRPTINAEFDLEPLLIDNDLATPLALLVGEVVTNALKYAFPGRSEGRLSVALKRRDGDAALLTIADDGVGFEPDSAHRGMGSRLIDGSIRQLGGSYRYESDHGATFIAELVLAIHGKSDSAA